MLLVEPFAAMWVGEEVAQSSGSKRWLETQTTSLEKSGEAEKNPPSDEFAAGRDPGKAKSF